MNWDDLRILHHVALRGSFLKAGQDLNMSASTVSRRISQMEEAVSAILVERGNEGVRLTALGIEFAEIAKSVSSRLDRQIINAGKGPEALSGTVLLTSGEGFVDILSMVIAQFIKNHGNCSVDYAIESEYKNLVQGEADVAVRIGNQGETSLIYRKLTEVNFAFFASQAYIDSNLDRLSPGNVDYIDLLPPMDLSPHRQLAFEAGFRNIRARTSSFRAQVEAIRLGVGVAAVPRIMSEGLTEVFKEVQLPPIDVFLVTRPSALKQAHIRSFVDILYQVFEKARPKSQPASEPD